MTTQDEYVPPLPAHLVWLTTREREILRLRQNGMTNKEVATALGIEVQTVKNHMRNLSSKLRLAHRHTL